MEGLYDSLRRAQDQLRGAGIDSAAIGALAVNIHGRARATNDVDLKVALDRDRAALLLQALGPAYQSLTPDPLGRLERLGFVFTRDAAGNRIDFLLADMEFDEEVLRRAQDIEVRPGLEVRLCTAEDLIIYKLISNRERDHDDARTVCARQQGRLDIPYIERWLREFELALDDSTLVTTFRSLSRPSS